MIKKNKGNYTFGLFANYTALCVVIKENRMNYLISAIILFWLMFSLDLYHRVRVTKPTHIYLGSSSALALM